MTEIIDVEFLTPARIKLKTENSDIVEIMVQVDIVSRKVYDSTGQLLELSDSVFNFLDEANSLPEDFFAAPEEVSRSALELFEQSDTMRNSYGGEEWLEKHNTSEQK